MLWLVAGRGLCLSASMISASLVSRGRGARELVGQPCVQFLALAREDRRVDRRCQDRVPEAEDARCLVGNEDFVLGGLAQ
jgi:hypothetical protein